MKIREKQEKATEPAQKKKRKHENLYNHYYIGTEFLHI